MRENDLLQYDLVSTIGESVALGAAGIILWGEAADASSSVSNHTLIMESNVSITQTRLTSFLQQASS